MDALEGILQAYVLGLTHCFTITVACACAAFVAAACLQWKSVKDGPKAGEKKSVENNDVEAGTEVEKDALPMDSEEVKETT